MNPNVTVIQATKTEEKGSKIRVAAYCRVSSDSADQINSYMAQLRYYENFLNDSETESLVNVYADEGITGTCMDKRDDFLRMLKDCHRGKIDRIITKSVSRFARNTKECLEVIRELKELGITVMFEKEGIDTANLSDEMMITIMGGLAQEESTSISQNLKWSYRKRCQSGTITPFSAPFGYRLENGKLVINEAEAKIVKEVFEMYLSGIGIQGIRNICCRKYSEHKSVFSFCGIRYMLSNEKYIGDSEYQKSYTTVSLPYKKVKNRGVLDRYYLSDTHEAIISADMFESAQKIMERRHFEKIVKSYPLSQKIVCGNCNVFYKRKSSRGKNYWVCRNHDESAKLCSSARLNETQIYEAFITLYNKLKCQYNVIFPTLISQLCELKNKKFSGNQKYMDIAKEIAKLKEQTHVLARLKTKGFLDDSKYIEQTNELTAKIEKLSREQRKIVQSDDEDEIIDQIKEIADIIENGTDLMINFDEVMFESIVEKIIVKNQTSLEFHLYGGLKFTEELR